MPGLNRTGPEGQGSRTGRQMGRCTLPAKKSNEQSNQESLQDNLKQDESLEYGGLRGFGRLHGRGRVRGKGRGMGKNRGR